MKQALMFATTLAVASALSGCVTFEEEIGIPIEIIGEKDMCMEKLYNSMASEFYSLSKADRKAFKTKLKAKFNKIVIDRSPKTEEVSGTITHLALVERHGDYTYDRASKVIGTNLTATGKKPETVVRKDGALEIQMQSSLDISVRTFYVTRNVVSYDIIENTADPIFLSERQAGRVKLTGENAEPTWHCSEPPKLASLVE